LSDVLFANTELTDLRSIRCKLSQEIAQKDNHIAGQNDKIAELETKLAEVEEELKRENSAKLYWYERYMDLFNSADKKGDPNAQAKTS
jgi:uncharacterized protein (DUF3084 family)